MRPKRPDKPTQRMIRAHFDAQAPLDMKPEIHRHKKTKRDWDKGETWEPEEKKK